MKATIRVDMNKAMAAAEAIADNRRIARDLEQTYSNEWEPENLTMTRKTKWTSF